MPAPESAASPGTDTPVQEVEVAIIGSGFSGIGMAVNLLREGMTDFVVLERGDDVGGTWHFNTYPGCACDVPSHLYSFSFAPNPEWTQTYSRQPEIGAYLKRVADDFGVRPYVRTNHDVTAATWDEPTGRWIVESTGGTFSARVLVAGLGPLADPKIPDVPGLDTFTGHAFHSARWDHDYDLRGKRVAVVGTGASAIQLVPAIQPVVEKLYVVQRTPPWVLPHTNRPITRAEKLLYKAVPPLQRLSRGAIYTARETLVLGFVKQPRLMALVQKLAEAHMRRQISDPELLEKVRPDYTIGCKRILPSNGWYKALGAPNAELLTGGVQEVRGSTIVTGDGSEVEVDAMIYGTGFAVTDMPVGRIVRGAGGKTLDEHWKGSPKAYLGTAIAGFPNLFMMLGPNTGLGHSSMVYMIESQIRHVMAAIRTMKAQGADRVEVRPEAAERFNERIEAQHEGTVWSTGCASWYLDDTGRNATLWPDFTFKFRRRAQELDPAAYRIERHGDRTPVAA